MHPKINSVHILYNITYFFFKSISNLFFIFSKIFAKNVYIRQIFFKNSDDKTLKGNVKTDDINNKNLKVLLNIQLTHRIKIELNVKNHQTKPSITPKIIYILILPLFTDNTNMKLRYAEIIMYKKSLTNNPLADLKINE